MTINYVTLFKYLPFNENSIKALTEGTFKYTNSAEFNDPFDCSPFMYTASPDEFAKQMKGKLKEFGSSMKLSPAKRLQDSRKNLHVIKATIEKPEYFQETVASGFGVLSLSQNSKNILMWSHYADHHKGFLLKLLSPVSGSQDNKIVDNGGYHLLSFPVIYSNQRPALKYPLEDQNLKHAFLNAVTTKATDWSYEEEYRVVDHKRGVGIHPYNIKTCLDGIILGARMEETNKARLFDIVSDISTKYDKEVTIEQAQLSERHFEVDIVKL